MLKLFLEKLLGLSKSKKILGFDDSNFYFLGCLINTAIMMGILYMELFLNGPWKRYVVLWLGVFI